MAFTHVGSFFAPLAPVNRLFDPKAIYDQYAGRFLVVALERQDPPSNTSRILLAVSDDSDPNGSWYFHAINSKININGNDTWADYPGFAVDEEAVYITNNMFTFVTREFAGSLLWIVDKQPFYSGGAASVAVYDPSGAVGGGLAATTMQPAHIFGSAPAGVGTWLVRNGFLAVIPSKNFSASSVSMTLWGRRLSRMLMYPWVISKTLQLHCRMRRRAAPAITS